MQQQFRLGLKFPLSLVITLFLLCSTFHGVSHAEKSSTISSLNTQPSTSAQQNNLKTLKIGVLAFRGYAASYQQWSMTAKTLSQSIPGYHFEINPLTNDDIVRMVERQKVDFVITNPGSYAQLEANHGVSRLATIRKKFSGNDNPIYGSVIFARADSTINTLKDIKNKSFMAVHKKAFGGWWMAKREFLEDGINEDDFSQLSFVGFPQDQIVNAVIEGKVDAGTVRTGLIEQLVAEGKLDGSKIKIINPNKTLYFPQQHSTRLYPEWPFVVTKHVDSELAKKVALTLFSLPNGHPSLSAANISGWSTPLNYQPVHELMQELKVGHYEKISRLNLVDIINKHWVTTLVVISVLIVLVLITIYILGLNKRLLDSNKLLKHEVANRINFEEKLKQRALFDQLTSIPNRALLYDRIQQAIYSGKRDENNFTVALIDLNGFKLHNDTLGHQFGDRILTEVAQRFKNSLRKTDTIARLGGDEFVILIPDTIDSNIALDVTKKCLETLNEPIHVNGKDCLISASIGIARYPCDGDNISKLLHHADLAMYKAKNQGTSIEIFEPESVVIV